METSKSIVPSLQRGDFLASIDYSEANLHIPIPESHWRVLCFTYNGLHAQCKGTSFWPQDGAVSVHQDYLVSLIAQVKG